MITLAMGSATAQAQPGGAGGGGGPPPARVRVDPARLETLGQMREVTGELRAARRSRVAAREPGIVVELGVQLGDTVEKDQVLARLDDALVALQVSRQEAEAQSKTAIVAAREADVEKAERDLVRRRAALEQGGANETEVQDAETQARTMRAKLAEAKADLASARAAAEWWNRRLADTVIRAPIAGAVVAKGTEVGEWVREGATVVEVVELGALDAFLDVPQKFLGSISAPGTNLQLRIDALGRMLEAPIASIIPDGDRLSRTFAVKLSVGNPEGVLKPGMTVVGLVPTGEAAPVVTIHKDAVLRNDAGPFIYINAGGVAAPMPVTPLFAVGERLAVRAERLEPGTPVLVEGNERVYPGQPLMLIDAQGQPAATKAEGGK